jgi:hypothetical protein
MISVSRVIIKTFASQATVISFSKWWPSLTPYSRAVLTCFRDRINKCMCKVSKFRLYCFRERGHVLDQGEDGRKILETIFWI